MKNLIELNLPHDPLQLQFFRYLRDLTPDDSIIVEIGSYVGAVANQFVGGNRKVFSIDPWQEDNVYDKNDIQYGLIEDAKKRGGINVIYKTWMKNAGEDLFINLFPIKGFSHDIAPYFNLSIDLLYIDGCHNYESVIRDLNMWVPKVKNGGIIAGDDHSPGFPGVQKAVTEYFGANNYQVLMGNQWFLYNRN